MVGGSASDLTETIDGSPGVFLGQTSHFRHISHILPPVMRKNPALTPVRDLPDGETIQPRLPPAPLRPPAEPRQNRIRRRRNLTLNRADSRQLSAVSSQPSREARQ